MEKQCKTCLFLLNVGNKYGGTCRRYPPVVSTMRNANGEMDWSTDWPFVANEAWCGEYKPSNSGA